MIEICSLVLCKLPKHKTWSWVVTSPTDGVLVVSEGHKTAKVARKDADAAFTKIDWATPKKAYVRIESEDE